MRERIAIMLVATVALLPVEVLAVHPGSPLHYDIVYVRQPRYGDYANTAWPEVFNPMRLEPGADLVLLHPDGSEEILVEAAEWDSVTDPFVSFDARWVYFSYFYDVRWNVQRDLPAAGADIYRINLETRELQQLTFAGGDASGRLAPGEFTPNTAAGRWYHTGDGAAQPNNVPEGFNYLGYGIFNTGPVPIAGGKVAFTSNRNGFTPPKGGTSPTMQLFIMDEDGANVELIGSLNVSSALHPTPLKDGRIMFSSHESQGLRDPRLWGASGASGRSTPTAATGSRC